MNAQQRNVSAILEVVQAEVDALARLPQPQREQLDAVAQARKARVEKLIEPDGKPKLV
jgi:hypothetical protein